MKTKIIIATVLLLISTQAFSYDGWLNIHLGSSHEKRTYIDQSGNDIEYNQKNFGLGLSVPAYSNIDARAGFFENSFNNTSYYAGADFHYNTSRYITVGVNAGVASGYEHSPVRSSALAPMFVPHVTMKVKNFRTEIGYVPSFDEKQVAFWTFTIGTRF